MTCCPPLVLTCALLMTSLHSEGRSPLATCTSAEVTELLIHFQADPEGYAGGNGGGSGKASAVRFATEYVKVHYLGTIADKTDQLREVKKTAGSTSLAETAEAMARVVATAQLELQRAFMRALCSTVPLFEALAEGKLEKAEPVKHHHLQSTTLHYDSSMPSRHHHHL